MTHEPLIKTLTIFYNTLAALCYIDASDVIVPPVSINIVAAQDAGLSDEAVSLIQRLPSLSGDLYDRSILSDGTIPVFYAEDNHLGWARRPTLQDEPEIPGTQFVLTNANIYGTALIYDTETRKLLAWKPFVEDADQEMSETAFSTDQTQAQPPEQLIGGWIKTLISLEWLPCENQLIVNPTVPELQDATRHSDLMEQYQLQFVQRTLKDVYTAAGWDVTASDLESASSGFDPDVFATEKDSWMERTQDLLDRAYEECWSWRAIREAIGGELATSDIAGMLDVPISEGWQPRHLEL